MHKITPSFKIFKSGNIFDSRLKFVLITAWCCIFVNAFDKACLDNEKDFLFISLSLVLIIILFGPQVIIKSISWFLCYRRFPRSFKLTTSFPSCLPFRARAASVICSHAFFRGIFTLSLMFWLPLCMCVK